MNIRSKGRHSLYASIGTMTDNESYHALAVNEEHTNLQVASVGR